MVDIEKQTKELFDVKAHLGHKTNRVHPKSKKYIYSVENGISVLDLTQTVTLLEAAKQFVSTLAKENKVLLVVCTKKIASTQVQIACKKNSIAYVSTKWPAGLLTNFDTIMKNVKKLIQMKKDKTDGAWQKFVKHDRVRLEKEMTKLEKAYGGLVPVEKLPDALFVIDIKKEKNAVNEAGKTYVPVIAITDTNVNPDLVNYPIPANDDSLSSVEYIVSQIIDSYARHKATKKAS